jgi:hypothetical protein
LRDRSLPSHTPKVWASNSIDRVALSVGELVGSGAAPPACVVSTTYAHRPSTSCRQSMARRGAGRCSIPSDHFRPTNSGHAKGTQVVVRGWLETRRGGEQPVLRVCMQHARTFTASALMGSRDAWSESEAESTDSCMRRRYPLPLFQGRTHEHH